jgi:hypothetical protein
MQCDEVTFSCERAHFHKLDTILSARPREHPNNDAGLDVSPAVRTYLGLSGTDCCDRRFVEARSVPPGPWRQLHQEPCKRISEEAVKETTKQMAELQERYPDAFIHDRGRYRNLECIGRVY